MKFTIEHKHWPPAGLVEPIRAETWQEHRSVLAAETTVADWRTLQNAVFAIGLYQRTREDEIAKDKPELEGWLGALQKEKTAIEEAREVLEPFVAD